MNEQWRDHNVEMANDLHDPLGNVCATCILPIIDWQRHARSALTVPQARERKQQNAYRGFSMSLES